MSQNKNKIEELEKKVLDNSDIKNKLFIILDPLVLWIEEMTKSFSSLFTDWNNDNYKITLEMDEFENNLKKLKK